KRYEKRAGGRRQKRFENRSPPATRAASSKLAPSRRNTGVKSITLNQMPLTEVWTQMIPQKLYGLNREPSTNGNNFSAVLSTPKLGSRIRIQARTKGKSGTK